MEAINFRITRLIELDLWSLQLVIHFCFLDEVKDYSRMNNGNEADFPHLKTSGELLLMEGHTGLNQQVKIHEVGEELVEIFGKICF